MVVLRGPIGSASSSIEWLAWPTLGLRPGTVGFVSQIWPSPSCEHVEGVRRVGGAIHRAPQHEWDRVDQANDLVEGSASQFTSSRASLMRSPTRRPTMRIPTIGPSMTRISSTPRSLGEYDLGRHYRTSMLRFAQSQPSPLSRTPNHQPQQRETMDGLPSLTIRRSKTPGDERHSRATRTQFIDVIALA